MGNTSSGIKKFLQNKNTVTVFGVILAILILYFAYNWRVNKAVNPINVPYATQDISPGTQITADMVGIRAVPPSMLEGEVLTNQGQVIDKYSSADTVIPKGNLFYERTVVEKEQLDAIAATTTTKTVAAKMIYFDVIFFISLLACVSQAPPFTMVHAMYASI